MKNKVEESHIVFDPCTQGTMDAGDEVVVSGFSGRFPDSDNVKHLQENLFNKVDLISDDDRRWNLDHVEIPPRVGKINNLGKFDALFFGVHFKQAHTMDPMCRMLMEHAYEAVIDAGVNPRQLRGTKTGVFVGACFSESEKTWFYEKLQGNGFGLTGCSKAMLANRISYWFGVTGPSYTVDTACSSSFFAMEQAYRAIRNGSCDAAIVGGSNLCLHPYVSLQFNRLGVLSPEGKCRCFDADANGYTRSETVSVAFLQRAKDAKRIYGTIVHAKTNCDGFKPQGITFPSSMMQAALLKEFYEECKVAPNSLTYVEAHGTGTKVGDPEELAAIDSIFCTDRKTPLRIGSIKSNLGHAEPASGMCSLAKVIITNETGMIPPNLHYKRPREGVKGLEEGRLQVVTEPTPWEGGHIAISSFGFGGANAHILIRSNPKEKINGGAPQDDLPRLVAVSGRSEEAVNTLLQDIENRPIDIDFIKLLHDIHVDEIPGHLYRGYTVKGDNMSPEKRIREIDHYPGAKRPIWFVFSGMGSQWAGMGTALLRMPVFAKAVKKCDNVLKPRGVDIYNILTNPDKTTFDNILNSFVGIAAVQIGLVDLLESLNIVPDHIIGHSVGELGCAYADGCFTAEQMVLAAYSRGLASIETDTIRGSMAAVGLGYNDVKDLCPPDIEVACHNGPESSTISGPADSMKAFVAHLQAKKIFAREVPCSNIAYHSRYIADAGPRLLKYLKEVIPDPKPRSAKWVSTSVPRNQWTTPKARFSSAEYHTNNLLNAVLFEETSTIIPKDAVTIEIAPHGLLQAILKRSLNAGVTNIALTQRGHKDNVEVFVQAIGKLYNVGLQPLISNLYPEVRLPVPRGTAMISPLIKWEHSDDWYVTSFKQQDKITSGERIVEVTLSDEDYDYMAGHIIDGRNLVPATGYLQLVWETVGMMEGEYYSQLSIVFQDVKFLRATTLPKEGSIELTVMVQKGTGRFEVVEGGAAVVTGYVHSTTKPSLEKMNTAIPKHNEKEEMSSRDFYKELRLRGYHYEGLFKSIKSATTTGSRGKIAWHNNWVAFMDNMLQIQILGIDSRGLRVPTGIQKLVIDTKMHVDQVRTIHSETKELPVYCDRTLNLITAGGVEIRGLQASAIPRRKNIGVPVLESYKFVAHRDRAEMSLNEAVHVAVHISLENHLPMKVTALEAFDASQNSISELISPIILETLNNLPLIQADVGILAGEDTFEEGNIPPSVNVVDLKKLPSDVNALLLSGHSLLCRKNNESMAQLLHVLRDNGFVLTLESGNVNDLITSAKKYNLDIVFEKIVNKSVLLLLRKHQRMPTDLTIVRVNNDKFTWVDELKTALKAATENEASGNVRIVVVGEKQYENGVLGLVNCLRREPGGEMVRCFLIQDEKAPNFSVPSPFYASQLNLDLVVNVLRSNNTWGSYRHLYLPPAVPRLCAHAWANQLVRGDLSSFQWFEGPIKPGFSHPDLVRIVYSAINFRDIMLASGKLATEIVAKTRAQEECILGFEYCGVDLTGQRIMGLIPSQALTNQAVIDRNLSWNVPKGWTLEDAATVPCVYATSYYALYISGNMRKGDKVLIHAGSGGVGQAAITLALNEGCEVFTTVGTDDKRRFIRERFPQIPENHIGNSRDTSFEKLVLEQTNGRGVDIVLNSLAEEKLQASIRCLAVCGRFLEIGKFDMANDSQIGMGAFLKEISFHGILLDNLFDAPPERKVYLKEIFQKGLDNGSIKPLTRTVFPKDQVEAAFRYMAAGKHIGKVIINVSDEKKLDNIAIPALPRYCCLPDRSYVILGGLGGFGLELVDWLILRGARNLVLTSRTGIKNGYQQMRIGLWRSYGARIVIVAGKDAANRKDCSEILKAAKDLAPVDGIFNLAVVLKDSLWENQTPEQFEQSFRPKAWSTKVLDELSRKDCPQLRHFVVFSSVSCGRGNAGQTNYGMSNSVMERICEKRVAEGFHALAIQWGAVGDVGLVADMQDNNQELIIGGTLQQKITSCLQELNGFLTQNEPIVASMVVAEKKSGGSGSSSIVDTVLEIMNVKDLKAISHQTALSELGMDSMMAVEIKQTLEREFEVFLTAQDIRGLNFAKLIEMSAQETSEKSKKVKKNTHEPETITGMKLLVRLLGEDAMQNEICLKLRTREEAGMQEVFLIPGIEGCASIFSNLTANIKSPATCLQLDNTQTNYLSIPEMAKMLLPHILTRIKGRRDFVITGYSFGSLIAIELARQLEAEGRLGKLILIDGAPELLKAIKHQQLMASTDDELETNVLMGIMDIIAPSSNQELLIGLQRCKSWKEKLDDFITHVPTESLPISVEHQKSICTAVYNRLKATENYDVSSLPPLRSSIILLKPSVPAVKNTSDDYGLSAITREKVEVWTVTGNHVTILDDEKIVVAINGEPLEDAEEFRASLMTSGARTANLE
uniref:Fatty acid synthase 2 n=1 Tax=Meteorus pulchricornis TaxID=51522 RepID=A0A7G8Z9J7_9HYME|nr:fatty acid synthase 2 [Meteorus pulchricornis]